MMKKGKSGRSFLGKLSAYKARWKKRESLSIFADRKEIRYKSAAEKRESLRQLETAKNT